MVTAGHRQEEEGVREEPRAPLLTRKRASGETLRSRGSRRCMLLFLARAKSCHLFFLLPRSLFGIGLGIVSMPVDERVTLDEYDWGEKDGLTLRL